ncbi:MAG: GAF domain-containing protein [Ideonella sp.]|nr:GAF domain-containing protein [Ideonella sp.]MCC7457616.1 GAF domain-containing protein [Nitrospira sp.]
MRTDWLEQGVELPPPAGRRSVDAGILAEITAGLAAGSDLHGLLERFLAPMMQIAGARAGAVRALSPAGDRLQMIGKIGLPEPVALAERMVDSGCGMCGSAFARGTIVSAGDLDHCARRSHETFFGQQCRHVMAVPLTYHGRVLGLYNLFFDREPATDSDLQTLLKSIGELLGLALHHALLERETLRATVLTERQAMAAEVHDSIAQTLAFVKMRLPLLEEAIAGHDEASAMKYCSDVRRAVSSAHGNLREVLTHFRAPFDPLGLRHALHDCIAAFRELTQIELALDEPLPELPLSVAQEFQLLRIVQEALANIAKHARARRAWLAIRRQVDCVDVVVEDDGTGVAESRPDDGLAHYGLDIMRQRTRSLGGSLEVGARDGGGTRVHLRFPVQAQTATAPWTP